MLYWQGTWHRVERVRGWNKICVMLRGWRNTVGNLIDLLWLKEAYHGPQFTGTGVNNRGGRFHRIRDFKHDYFKSIPPTAQRGCRPMLYSQGIWHRVERVRGWKKLRVTFIITIIIIIIIIINIIIIILFTSCYSRVYCCLLFLV